MDILSVTKSSGVEQRTTSFKLAFPRYRPGLIIGRIDRINGFSSEWLNINGGNYLAVRDLF